MIVETYFNFYLEPKISFYLLFMLRGASRRGNFFSSLVDVRFLWFKPRKQIISESFFSEWFEFGLAGTPAFSNWRCDMITY